MEFWIYNALLALTGPTYLRKQASGKPPKDLWLVSHAETRLIPLQRQLNIANHHAAQASNTAYPVAAPTFKTPFRHLIPFPPFPSDSTTKPQCSHSSFPFRYPGCL